MPSNQVASMYAILNRLSDKSLEAVGMWLSIWNFNNSEIANLLTRDSK